MPRVAFDAHKVFRKNRLVGRVDINAEKHARAVEEPKKGSSASGAGGGGAHDIPIVTTEFHALHKLRYRNFALRPCWRIQEARDGRILVADTTPAKTPR